MQPVFDFCRKQNFKDRCTLSEAKRHCSKQCPWHCGRSEVRILENATHINNIKIIIIKATTEFGWTSYRAKMILDGLAQILFSMYWSWSSDRAQISVLCWAQVKKKF
jgi:hypothetical protein